jgi:site-specific DNA recombinase
MLNHDLRVGNYARVSGDKQAKDGTIASQLDAIRARVASDGLECAPELCFVDDGYSGDILVRPGLERLRDQAAAGAIDRLYILDPDRISRKYAYQVLILEELTSSGVEVVFLRNPPGRGPEENLLLQVQGMIAEYERAKIMERLLPIRSSEPFASVWRAPPSWLSIRSSCSWRRSKVVLFSVLFAKNSLGWKAFVLFAAPI